MAQLRSFKPHTFEVRAGLPLLVLSCSKDKFKVDGWVRFGDLYDGPMWRQVRSAGYPMTNVAALSAGYGFLEPGHPVETYDDKMDEDSSARYCGTGNHVYRLANLIERAGSAFVVGGKLYQEIARTAERTRPSIRGRVAYAGGSYLAQRKQLGEWLRENTPVAADSAP